MDFSDPTTRRVSEECCPLLASGETSGRVSGEIADGADQDSQLKVCEMHILPSYQLHQHLFELNLDHLRSHSIGSDEESQLPVYTPSDEYEVEFPRQPVLELPLPQTGSSNCYLTERLSLPYQNNDQIKLEIAIENEKEIYSTGDEITGKLYVENLSSDYVLFDTLIVSLEGRFSQLTGPLISSELIKRRIFLDLVDICSSLTDNLDIEYEHLELQLQSKNQTQGLPPNSKFVKNFYFKIPNSLVNDNDFLSRSLSLPPSLGLSEFKYPINSNVKSSNASFDDWKSWNDLTGLSTSITYSINVRILVINPATALYNILSHEIKFFRMIPKAVSMDYHNFMTPTQQLNDLLDRLEELLLKDPEDNANDILYSSDREKSIYQSRQELNSCFSLYSCSTGPSSYTNTSKIPKSFHSPDIDNTFSNELCLVFKKLFKTPKVRQHGSLSICTSKEHEIPQFRVCYETKTASTVEAVFDLIYTPPAGGLKNDDLILLNNPHSLDLTNKVLLDLKVFKIKSQENEIPIDLDPIWYLNTDTYSKYLYEPLQEIFKLKEKHKKKKLSRLLVNDVNGLITIDKEVHCFSNLIKIIKTPTDLTAWEVVETDKKPQDLLSYRKKMKLSFTLDPRFLEKFLIVPSFQSRQLARMYSSILRLDISKDKFFKHFSIAESELKIDFPIRVVHQDS